MISLFSVSVNRIFDLEAIFRINHLISQISFCFLISKCPKSKVMQKPSQVSKAKQKPAYGFMQAFV